MRKRARFHFASPSAWCVPYEPTFSDDDCYDDGTWDINTFDVYTGNMDLDVETSKSFSAGFVWSPFANLDLDGDESGTEIKSRYKDLVKRLHPDANGGDRSSEDRLRQIIQAYHYLKAAGFC